MCTVKAFWNVSFGCPFLSCFYPKRVHLEIVFPNHGTGLVDSLRLPCFSGFINVFVNYFSFKRH